MSDTVSVLDLGCYVPDRPVLVTATDPAAPSWEPVTQIAAPGPVGPQHAPSPVMLTKECGWKRGERAERPSSGTDGRKRPPTGGQ